MIGLQALRNALRQARTQLSGLYFLGSRACMVELMSLDPSSLLVAAGFGLDRLLP